MSGTPLGLGDSEMSKMDRVPVLSKLPLQGRNIDSKPANKHKRFKLMWRSRNKIKQREMMVPL